MCFCALTLELAVFEKEKNDWKSGCQWHIPAFSCLPMCGATLHRCEQLQRCLVEGLGHAEGEGPKVEGENVKKEKYSNLDDIGCDGMSFGQRLLFLANSRKL